jgi:cystatin-C
VKKKIIFCSFVALFVFGIFAAESGVSAQDIAGGYGDASVTDKDVRSAANFAIKSRSRSTGKTLTLVKIVKAEVQVVAGLNYRVCMTVREGRKAAKTITAVVYKDLQNRRSLSRWKVGGCSEL